MASCVKAYITLLLIIIAIIIGYKVAIEETEKFGVMRRRCRNCGGYCPYGRCRYRRMYRPWSWYHYFSPYSWYNYWRPPYNYSQVSPIIANIN
jgi:hypothetical protein